MAHDKRRYVFYGGLAAALAVMIVAAGVIAVQLARLNAPAGAAQASDTSNSQDQSSSLVDPGTSLQGIQAPDFTLTNQFGHSVSLSQFRGKAVIIAFTDTTCTNVCPLTSQSLLETLNLLGPAAQHVQLLAVDANPEATSVQDAKTFSVAHGMENRWMFLTGSKAQLEQVWKAYHIYVAIQQGTVDHTPGVFVLDPQGREQTMFLTSPQYGVVPAEAHYIAQAVAKVLPGDVQIPSSSVPVANTMTPAQSVNLPILTAQGENGTVALGPGKAHLTFFVASWSDGVQSQLSQLSQAASMIHGAQIVAVDIGSTEPSTASAQHMMQGLQAQLAFPVAIDKTGNVADAYGVQDVPWFTLTSSTGKVLWTHDGWMPPSQLAAAVQTALAKAG